eukprot:468423-Amphidinium_carterae.1
MTASEAESVRHCVATTSNIGLSKSIVGSVQYTSELVFHHDKKCSLFLRVFKHPVRTLSRNIAL